VAPWNTRKEHGTCRVQSCRRWPTKAILIWREREFRRERAVQCSEREERGMSRRYSTRQASGWADGGEPAIRQVWGMTLAGPRVIGGPPKCDKGHSRGHTRALERRLRARDRSDKSRLRCIVQAPAQARLRGHAGDGLSGRSTLLMLMLRACDAAPSMAIRGSSITAH
jgi:hypothetical protein